MKILTDLRATGIAAVVCVVVFLIADRTSVFGRFVNDLYPCMDSPVGVSMPCYAKYDLEIMAVAGMVGVAFLILFLGNVRLRIADRRRRRLM